MQIMKKRTKCKAILKSELPGFREAQGTDTCVQFPVGPTIPEC